MINLICYNTSMGFEPEKFQEFIQDKFAEWRGRGRETLVDFANYIGVSQQVMSNWYNGRIKRSPEADTYSHLIKKYGVEVYDVLGLPRPSEEEVLSGLPPDMAASVRSFLDEIRSSGINKGKEMASPEDLETIKAIFSKHLGKYLDK